MTVTLTYDGTNARVEITANALAAASYATIERSVDQIRWTTVRGGAEVAVSAGAFVASVYDYEFVDGVVNYYRVRGISTAAISFVAVGAPSTGSAGSRTPGAPAGLTAGDLVVIFASTRNSGVGTVDVPTGWTQLAASGNAALLGRVYDGVWAMPTVTFTGGAANEDTIAIAAAWRNAELTPVTSQGQLNSSAQNIAYPALTVPADDLLVLFAGWKADDWTSVAQLAGATEISENTTTAGNDAGQVWDYQIQTDASSITAGSFTVTGGGAAISRGLVVAFEHAAYLNTQTNSLTPSLGGQIWLKSIERPFLNRPVTVVDWSAPERTGRGAEYEVAGRSLPLATTELASGRRWQLDLYTPTAADRQTMDYVLAAGDTMFVHVPAGCEIPGGHVRVSGSAERRTSHLRGSSRVFPLQLAEVVAPGPDVVGATATWQTVLALYPTWADVLAAHPTWADLLTLIGDPSEVIVP